MFQLKDICIDLRFKAMNLKFTMYKTLSDISFFLYLLTLLISASDHKDHKNLSRLYLKSIIQTLSSSAATTIHSRGNKMLYIIWGSTSAGPSVLLIQTLVYVCCFHAHVHLYESYIIHKLAWLFDLTSCILAQISILILRL